MRYAIRFCVAMMLAAAASVASAAFHLFKVEQIYSNADGTVQFIVLKNGVFDGENFWQGRSITSSAPGVSHSFTFPSNLPDGFTGGKRVLVATQGFAALGLIAPDYVIPNHFIVTGGGNVNFADVYTLSYANLPTDGVNALYNTGAVARNLATNYAGDTVSLGAAVPNYQGLWYKSPAESEAGWGINFAHQGDVIFATWFTYDVNGKAWWLTMTANKTAEGVYSGQLIRTNATPFSAFVPPATATIVGTGTLTFTSATTGTFSYTVNDGANVATQTKAIVLQTFGPVPTCVWGAQAGPDQGDQLPGPVVGRSGGGRWVGCEPDAAGHDHIRDLVYLRRESQPVVVVGDRAADGVEHLLRNAGPNQWADIQRGAVRPDPDSPLAFRHRDVHVHRRQ